MFTTFLIVLGILTLCGWGTPSDACAITLLLKVLPTVLLFIAAIVYILCCQ